MINPKEIQNGCEEWEIFTTKVRGKIKKFVEYNCRTADGTLFAVVKPTLNECRNAFAVWIANRTHNSKLLNL